jgi:hypothetical protein
LSQQRTTREVAGLLAAFLCPAPVMQFRRIDSNQSHRAHTLQFQRIAVTYRHDAVREELPAFNARQPATRAAATRAVPLADLTGIARMKNEMIAP